MTNLSSYINVNANSVIGVNISASGNISSAQNISATNNISAGGNIDIDGEGRIGGNLQITGNIDFSGGGSINQIVSANGVFTGDASGFGALYAGTPGYTPVPASVAQFTSDANEYTQINAQNLNHGNTASMEYVITGDLGTDTTDYLDIGFSSSSWDGTQTNSLGNAVYARDAYIYSQGGGGGGNLVIGTTTSGRAIKFNLGGPDEANTRIVMDPSTGLTALDNITGGNLLSDGIVSATGNITGNYIFGNGSQLTGITVSGSNPVSTTGNVAGGNLISTGTVSATGNITANYFFGNGSQLTGIAGSYGNSDVATFLAAYGSNTISTTGNITTGNLRTAGNVTFTANAGQINFNTTAYITGNAVGREGSISLQPYTGAGSTFPGVLIGGAGRILAPNGSVHLVLNSNDFTVQVAQKIITGTAATSTSTGSLQVSGGIGATGNVYAGNVYSTGLASVTGNTTTGNLLTAGLVSATGNITGGNLISSATIFGNPDIVLGNIANASATKTRMVTDTTFSYIQTGNGTVGSTGNVVFSPYASATQRVVIDTSSGNLSATGNITAQNFIGNISITGNVTGTSPNVTLVAGSYNYVFDNTGILTLPASSGNEGGEIDFGKAANSSLSGNTVIIDQYVDRFRFFEAGGTTRGAYIDLSQAAAGVGTLLNNRVSGLVNAGTFVTMDLLKATVTTSGNRGLSLAATTGSFNINISGTYGGVGGASGSAGTGTINTTASTSQFGWNFTSQGEGSTYIITDTTNNRAYRVTLQIGGSFNNNLISIERLV